VVEEKVDVEFLARFGAGEGAEQAQVLDTKSLQLGFVLLQSAYGFLARHGEHCRCRVSRPH